MLQDKFIGPVREVILYAVRDFDITVKQDPADVARHTGALRVQNTPSPAFVLERWSSWNIKAVSR